MTVNKKILIPNYIAITYSIQQQSLSSTLSQNLAVNNNNDINNCETKTIETRAELNIKKNIVNNSEKHNNENEKKEMLTVTLNRYNMKGDELNTTTQCMIMNEKVIKEVMRMAEAADALGVLENFSKC